ncbi:hypothetical protein [Dysgonomonas macrotermitis]|uniref:Uncharacterized protein n=1 Tax=Dysgonomonas macrotermitis TaxID=1346286 RepID=A0A1M5C567_9BACT|nr:hypothetical protein [Dysgonomonas macrotermitis]SHF49851.1 hypothetical protein SAMN05444362_10734 [Dysgonomonas macrotermitis]
MILLDKTYFQGILNLPNISYNDREGLGSLMQSVGESNLNYFIAKYEPECLSLILGEDLYSAFIDGLYEDPNNEIWINMKDALFRKEGKYGFSPVANYVYFYAMKDSRSKTTPKGEISEASSFSESKDNQFKMINAWNDMCTQVFRFRKNFLLKNWADYKVYANGLDVRICGVFEPINALDI